MVDPVNVGIAGLGFGAEFIPIYRDHPDARMFAICQRSEESLNSIGDAFGIERRFYEFRGHDRGPRTRRCAHQYANP